MLTSDRVPRDLDRLHARLRDRFDAGLVAEIEPPDLATRMAVLRKHAAHNDLPLPTDEAMELIAARVDDEPARARGRAGPRRRLRLAARPRG